MSKYIFNLNEKVEVLCDDEFWGAEGEQQMLKQMKKVVVQFMVYN